MEADQPKKSVEELSAELTRDFEKSHRSLLWALFAVSLPLLFMVLMIVVPKNKDEFEQVLASGVFLELLLFIWWTRQAMVRRAQLQERLRQLAQFNDLHAVAPMIEAFVFHGGDMDTRDIAADALIQLLPQMQTMDAALITHSQHDQLRRILRNPNYAVRIGVVGYRRNKDYFRSLTAEKSTDLRAAILQAFGHIGDSSDLEIVNRIILSKTKDMLHERLRNAAMECQPLLQARVAAQLASRQLLRPAAEANQNDALLLRPASRSPEEELLRPAEQSLE